MAKKGSRTASVPRKSGKTAGKKSSAPRALYRTANGSGAAASLAEPKPRQLKQPKYKSLRLQKKIKAPKHKIASSFTLFGRAVSILVKNWPVFLGIIIVYAILSVILVGGISAASSSNLTQLKQSLSQVSGLSTGLGLFTYLAGNAGYSNSPAGGITQSVLIIFISLALIWALRQAYAKQEDQVLRIRDAFYNGMSQLVQFIMVLIVLLLEFLPLTIGALLYGIVITGNVAVTPPEELIFAIIFFLLAVASFYMITTSILAVYIVTLEGMTPIKALKSAANVVRYQRVKIFLKLLFLVIALLIIAAAITIPLALWATTAAPFVFYGLVIIFLAVVHSYIYALYREMI